MKISKYLLVLLAGLLSIFSTCTNNDIENVRLKCTVFQKNGETPIPNLKFMVHNYAYAGGPDAGYQQMDEYEVVTDENGSFSLNFDRSAYVQIDTLFGDGKLLKELYIKKQNVNATIYLD